MPVIVSRGPQESKLTQVRGVGVYSATHPSEGAKATVGSRGPPLVIVRQTRRSRNIVEQ
jgi:hypothetical protein